MYRLLELENIDISSIKSLSTKKDKLESLYFKWLITKNKKIKTKEDKKEIEEIKKVYRAKIEGLKVKGFIDLSKLKRR